MASGSPEASLTVATRTVAKKSKLRIDVARTPPRTTTASRFNVGWAKWRNARTGSTSGTADTAVVNQRRGMYRVVVATVGATGVSSRPIRVVR